MTYFCLCAYQSRGLPLSDYSTSNTLYLEDVNYCVAAVSAGYELWLDPAAVVTHRTSSSPIPYKIIYSFRAPLSLLANGAASRTTFAPSPYSIFIPKSTLSGLQTWQKSYTKVVC
jgi:hypothetical protein